MSFLFYKDDAVKLYSNADEKVDGKNNIKTFGKQYNKKVNSLYNRSNKSDSTTISCIQNHPDAKSGTEGSWTLLLPLRAVATKPGLKTENRRTPKSQ